MCFINVDYMFPISIVQPLISFTFTTITTAVLYIDTSFINLRNINTKQFGGNVFNEE